VEFVAYLLRDCQADENVVWFADERLKSNADNLVYLMRESGLSLAGRVV